MHQQIQSRNRSISETAINIPCKVPAFLFAADPPALETQTSGCHPDEGGISAILPISETAINIPCKVPAFLLAAADFPPGMTGI